MDTSKILGQVYRPRVIHAALDRALASAGAVVIEGARASGKTMTALQAAGSYAFIDDDDMQRALSIAPGVVLEGAAPRLLDEWQVAPELWNRVRRAVDRTTEPGQFILTGSATPSDDITRHTGAGRFLRLRQRPMTWWEKREDLSGRVSLSGLFDGERPAAEMTAGPELDEITRTDIRRLAGVRHHPDVRAVAPGITVETIGTYVELLQRLFIVEPQLPWTPQLRSRARLRTSPKLHLVNASLAAASLGAGPHELRNDLGTLFESAVVHDLTVYASAMGGETRHYRDSNGKEVDAIVTLPDGRWGAVEVKLGGGQVSAGVESLNKVIDQIDTDAVGQPAFRLVVAGTGPILTTDNGTVITPLTALTP